MSIRTTRLRAVERMAGAPLVLSVDEQRAMDLVAELAPETPGLLIERAVLMERSRAVEKEAAALLSGADATDLVSRAQAATALSRRADSLASALEDNLGNERRFRAATGKASSRRRKNRPAVTRKKYASANPVIGIRLDPEILDKIQERIPAAEAGRGGGVSHWIRRLIFRELGIPEPEPYAEGLSPRKERKRARIETGDNAPAPLRDAFLLWLNRYTAGEAALADTLPVDGTAQPLSWVLGQLWTAPDDLPPDFCDRLELPHGSSYARAARQAKATLQADEKRRRKDAARFKVIPPD